MPIAFPSTALIRRELLGNFRRTRSFVCLGIFVGAAISVAVGYYPEDIRNLTAAGQAATDLVEIYAIVMFVGAVLFVPALAGGAIATEKEQRTFDALTLTPIPPSGIILAKLLNTVGFYLLLVIATMPVLGVAFFLVRVGWADVLKASAVILATAFSCAMVGILSSALFRKPLEAIAFAYLGMLMLVGGTAFLGWLLVMLFGPVPMPNVQACIRILCPIVTLEQTVFYGGVTRLEFALAMLYQVAFFVMCYGLALLVLQRVREMPEAVAHRPTRAPALLELRRKRFPFYLIDPLRGRKAISDNQNPMLVKDLLWGVMGRGTILLRVFYVSFIIWLVVGVGWVRGPRPYNGLVSWLLAQIIVTVAVVPALVADAFAKEYQVANIDMLRMTLLKPRDIVLGKAFAGAIVVAPALLGGLLSCISVMLAAQVPGGWALLLAGCTTLLVCALISLSVGLLASLLTKKTALSIALSYLFSVVVFAGAWLWMTVEFLLPPVPAGIMWAVSRESPSLHELLSPILAFLFGTEPGQSPLNKYWFGSIVAFTLLGVAVIWLSIIYFQRYRMRDR